MVKERVYCRVNILFPYFQYLEFDRVCHPIYIHTSEERIVNFLCYIQNINVNFWIADEYTHLREAISSHAAKLVFKDRELLRALGNGILNSPYGARYCSDMRNVIDAMLEGRGTSEELESIKNILIKSGGYTIEFSNESTLAPENGVLIIEDEQSDLLLRKDKFNCFKH